ncbi:hypothetical protein Syn6312_0391 [Synechococcus sp. PCC 6312]|nr:hypothetical protein Syn6312_0391 [Synechococcus sp. PCC 6312]
MECPVNAKSPVKAAIDEVRDLSENMSLGDLIVEEVKFSENTDQWLVVVVFLC